MSIKTKEDLRAWEDYYFEQGHELPESAIEDLFAIAAQFFHAQDMVIELITDGYVLPELKPGDQAVS